MRTIAVNYLAVVVAALAGLVIGWLWYGPILGKTWRYLSKIPKPRKVTTGMMAQGMVGGLVTSFLVSWVLAYSIIFAGAFFRTRGIMMGVRTGFWDWLGFIVPVTLGIVLWEGKSWRLWVLNASYWLVTLIVMGIILGAWR